MLSLLRGHRDDGRTSISEDQCHHEPIAASGPSNHRGSKPAAIQAGLTAGEVRNAISALAASGCVLSELIPATYKE